MTIYISEEIRFFWLTFTKSITNQVKSDKH